MDPNVYLWYGTSTTRAAWRMLLPENGTIKTYSAIIWNLSIVIKIRCGYQRPEAEAAQEFSFIMSSCSHCHHVSFYCHLNVSSTLKRTNWPWWPMPTAFSPVTGSPCQASLMTFPGWWWCFHSLVPGQLVQKMRRGFPKMLSPAGSQLEVSNGPSRTLTQSAR